MQITISTGLLQDFTQHAKERLKDYAEDFWRTVGAEAICIAGSRSRGGGRFEVTYEDVGIGALIAVVGLTILLVDTISTTAQSHEVSAIAFGMVLMLASIAARNLPALRADDDSREASDLTAIAFLGAWRKFVAAAAQALESKRAEFSPHSIVSILSSLADADLVDPEDVEQLRLLLKMRISLVHGVPPRLPQVAIDRLAGITERLRTVPQT